MKAATKVKPDSKPDAVVFNFTDLRKRYEDLTVSVIAQCTFATESVGGQPAGPEGVRAFAQHHLELKGKELDEAVARILKEEIGERDITPEGGELKEKLTYGINVIRRDAIGPWLGSWMPKACLKAAASRLGYFTGIRGLKGDMAEFGSVQAVGLSLRDETHPERIYLVDAEKNIPVTTYFKRFPGRVSGPSGSKSIIHDSECVPPGTRFAFEYRFKGDRFTKPQEQVADIFAVAMIIGLGSVKAVDCGKFSINSLTISNLPK